MLRRLQLTTLSEDRSECEGRGDFLEPPGVQSAPSIVAALDLMLSSSPADVGDDDNYQSGKSLRDSE